MDNLENHVKCPVCKKIPEGQIFQCRNSHMICSSCVEVAKSCSTCSAPLIKEEDRIRNTTLEMVLDTLTFPCPNKSLGCNALLKRGDTKKHITKECEYGENNMISLCTEIGYHNACTFRFHPEQIQTIVDHLQRNHSSTIIEASSATIQYNDFSKALNDLTSARYIGPTAIVQRVGHEVTTSFLILPISSTNGELRSCSWLCIYLGNSSKDKRQFNIEFTIKSQSDVVPELKWTTVAYCLENVSPFLENPAYSIPWPLLMKHYCEGSDLLLGMRIQQAEVGPIKGKRTGSSAPEKTVSLKMPLEDKSTVHECKGMLSTSKVATKISHKPNSPEDHGFGVLLADAYEAKGGERRRLEVLYAVNSGGDPHEDFHGVIYQKDPVTLGVAIGNFRGRKIKGLNDSLDEILYQTERYSSTNFGYELPVHGDGSYVLVLKFMEGYFGSANQRVFHVVLNSEHKIIENLDIVMKVGSATAHDEIIPFDVTDNGKTLIVNSKTSAIAANRIPVVFIKLKLNNPKIAALYLVRGTIEDIPKLPGSQTNNAK